MLGFSLFQNCIHVYRVLMLHVYDICVFFSLHLPLFILNCVQFSFSRLLPSSFQTYSCGDLFFIFIFGASNLCVSCVQMP